MHEVSDISTDPAAWRNAIGQGNRTVLTGTRGGVDIRVIVDTRTGQIISGYPTNIRPFEMNVGGPLPGVL